MDVNTPVCIRKVNQMSFKCTHHDLSRPSNSLCTSHGCIRRRMGMSSIWVRILRVIVYGSQTLKPTEKNYHPHSGKLEFLALKWAICEQFRDYLYYAPSFIIYTDNNTLTYVLSSTKLNATGLRWIGE